MFKIPTVIINVSSTGIAPQDCERMLIKPIEKHIRDIAGIKTFTSTAFEGGGNVTVQFNAGLDLDKAIKSVKEKINDAQHDLPENVRKPTVTEINPSLFPVLNIHLSGDMPKRTLFKLSEQLADMIENNVPQVLEAKIRGIQKEEIQILIDPVILESYRSIY